MIDDPREAYVMEVYERYETEYQSGMSECECDKIECPRHDGSFDCHSFCDICEGNQEYCATHDVWENQQAILYLKDYNA